MLFFVEILTLYITETGTEFLLYLPELRCLSAYVFVTEYR